MPSFNAIQSSQNTLERNSEGNLNISLPATSGKILPAGATVRIGSDGLLDSVTSAETAVGVVLIPTQKDSKITVMSRFVAIVNAKAKAAVTAGAVVTEVVADTITNGIPTYQTAVATNVAVGIALESASGAGVSFRVGIFSNPFTKA